MSISECGSALYAMGTWRAGIRAWLQGFQSSIGKGSKASRRYSTYLNYSECSQRNRQLSGPVDVGIRGSTYDPYCFEFLLQRASPLVIAKLYGFIVQ